MDSVLGLKFPTRDDEDINAFALVLHLVRFLEKYGCTRLWRQLHYCCVSKLYSASMSPRLAFVIGCASNNVELCRMSLDSMCGPHHCDPRTVPHECDADPGRFPLELWNLIDHE